MTPDLVGSLAVSRIVHRRALAPGLKGAFEAKREVGRTLAHSLPPFAAHRCDTASIRASSVSEFVPVEGEVVFQRAGRDPETLAVDPVDLSNRFVHSLRASRCSHRPGRSCHAE